MRILRARLHAIAAGGGRGRRGAAPALAGPHGRPLASGSAPTTSPRTGSPTTAPATRPTTSTRCSTATWSRWSSRASTPTRPPSSPPPAPQRERPVTRPWPAARRRPRSPRRRRAARARGRRRRSSPPICSALGRGEVAAAAVARRRDAGGALRRRWSPRGHSGCPLQHLTGRAPLPRPRARRRARACSCPGPRPRSSPGWPIDAARAGAAERGRVVVDLCTGFGAIALAVAAEVPGRLVIAVELDPLAHAWARAQRRRAGAGVDLRLGDAVGPTPALAPTSTAASTSSSATRRTSRRGPRRSTPRCATTTRDAGALRRGSRRARVPLGVVAAAARGCSCPAGCW